MQKVTKYFSCLLVFTMFPVFGSTPDLVLQKEITPEYIVYLTEKEVTYLAQTLIGGDDTQTMKAHMGLAILQAAWTHINGDTLINDLDYFMSDAGENATDILFQIFTDILPLMDADDQNEFFDNLVNFFESGTYPAFRDSVISWLANIESDFENAGEVLDYFGEKTDALAKMFGKHWDAVTNGTADFEFYVQLQGTQYEDTLFIFSREFFDRLERLKTLSEAMAQTMDKGFSQLGDILNQNSNQITPAINIIRDGLDSLYNLVDSVQILLWEQPFAPFEFDLSGLDSLQEFIVEVDTLLGGKEYPIGPEAENKTIRPLGFIESLAHPDGPWGVYEDYYRLGEPQNYTFSNIFPHGITQDMRTIIACDAVLNANDTFEELDARIQALQNAWTAKYSNTPDEYFGIALTRIFDLLTDEEYSGNVERAFKFISEGRIDSLVFYYDWSSFDLHDKIAEIRFCIDQYINSPELTNFVLLIKVNEDGLGPYELGTNSEFSNIYLTVPQIRLATEMMEAAINGMSLIATGVSNVYEELNQMFVLDLDPTVLNFSNVETELDIINILEQSNPEFLTLTPYGIEKFHEIGGWFEQAFGQLAMFFNNMTRLMNAMEPYQDDFGIDAAEFGFIMGMSGNMAWGVYEDFAHPDSTVMINGERVNLSAWFDNPPPSFLIMWKNFVTGVDSTLGGMFPDRYKELGTHAVSWLPKEFALYPVYPNPFNPIATIEFDLPHPADVKLTIINLKGEIVQELIYGHLNAGKITTQWNAANFPSGIYFGKLSVDGKITTRKMTLMK